MDIPDWLKSEPTTLSTTLSTTLTAPQQNDKTEQLDQPLPDLTVNQITCTGEVIPLSLDELLKAETQKLHNQRVFSPVDKPLSKLSSIAWLLRQQDDPVFDHPIYQMVIGQTDTTPSSNAALGSLYSLPEDKYWSICKPLVEFSKLHSFLRANPLYTNLPSKTKQSIQIMYAIDYIREWDNATKQIVYKRGQLDKEVKLDPLEGVSGYVHSFYSIMGAEFFPTDDRFTLTDELREVVPFNQAEEHQLSRFKDIAPSVNYQNIIKATLKKDSVGEEEGIMYRLVVVNPSVTAWVYRLMVLPNAELVWVRLSSPVGAITADEYMKSGLVKDHVWFANGVVKLKETQVVHQSKGGDLVLTSAKISPELIPWMKEVFENVLEDMYGGMVLDQILRKRSINIRKGAFLKWVAEDKKRQERYMDAQLIGSETMASETLLIADAKDAEGNELLEDVARSKIRIETRKWLSGVYNNRRYGAKQMLDVVTTVSIKDAMNEARGRVFNMEGEDE